jgi:hypothetical protein
VTEMTESDQVGKGASDQVDKRYPKSGKSDYYRTLFVDLRLQNFGSR